MGHIQAATGASVGVWVYDGREGFGVVLRVGPDTTTVAFQSGKTRYFTKFGMSQLLLAAAPTQTQERWD